MKREIGLTLLQKCADGMMCQTHQDSVKRFISGTLLRYADNISLSRQSTLSYIFFILYFFRAFPLKTINIFLASNGFGGFDIRIQPGRPSCWGFFFFALINVAPTPISSNFISINQIAFLVAQRSPEHILNQTKVARKNPDNVYIISSLFILYSLRVWLGRLQQSIWYLTNQIQHNVESVCPYWLQQS